MSTVALRHLARVVNGGTPTADSVNWGGGIPWATPIDLARVNGRHVSKTDRTLTRRGAVTGSALVPVGSILLSSRAPIGYTALTKSEMSFNQGCKALVPGQNVDPRFLQYCLIAQTENLKALGSGSTFLELSSESLASLLISLLPMSSQRRIADFLDDRVLRIDQIIAARRVQAALVESARIESIRELTDGDEEAKGWSRPRVAHVLRTGSGSTPPSDRLDYYDGGVPWVNTGDVRDGPLTATARTVSESALAEFSTLVRYPPGSLVIAMYGQGATKGRTALLGTAACVNQACCVLQGDSRLLQWAFHWFRAHKPDIVELANGAGQPNLSQDIIRSVRVTLPAPENLGPLLREIETHEAVSIGAQEVLRRQIAVLQEYKQSLITSAVTGEIDLTTTGSGIPG